MKRRIFLLPILMMLSCATVLAHESITHHDNSSSIQQKVKTVTIMGLGDSITQGGNYFTSYLYPLWKLLTKAGYDFQFVGSNSSQYDIGTLRHCGYSGQTAEYLASKISDWYRQYPADIVLLHSGHNHFIDEDPIASIIDSYKAIIDTIQSINPKARILAASIINSGKLPKYSYIPDLNKRIQDLVKEYNDKHIIFVNISKNFDWSTCTVNDMVHPNAYGAQIMADAWFKALRRLKMPRVPSSSSKNKESSVPFHPTS